MNLKKTRRTFSLADHSDSCKYLNASSTASEIFIQPCSISSSSRADEYECRKIIISYRSVETYLRRDCVPKGSCSWKDKTRAMIDTPVSNCVYTDERAQKLECIYCCDTPLCNSTNSNRWSVVDRSIFFFVVFLIFLQREKKTQCFESFCLPKINSFRFVSKKSLMKHLICKDLLHCSNES